MYSVHSDKYFSANGRYSEKSKSFERWLHVKLAYCDKHLHVKRYPLVHVFHGECKNQLFIATANFLVRVGEKKKGFSVVD